MARIGAYGSGGFDPSPIFDFYNQPTAYNPITRQNIYAPMPPHIRQFINNQRQSINNQPSEQTFLGDTKTRSATGPSKPDYNETVEMMDVDLPLDFGMANAQPFQMPVNPFLNMAAVQNQAPMPASMPAPMPAPMMPNVNVLAPQAAQVDPRIAAVIGSTPNGKASPLSVNPDSLIGQMGYK
jgi:hypothetical protein